MHVVSFELAASLVRPRVIRRWLATSFYPCRRPAGQPKHLKPSSLTSDPSKPGTSDPSDARPSYEWPARSAGRPHQSSTRRHRRCPPKHSGSIDARTGPYAAVLWPFTLGCHAHSLAPAGTSPRSRYRHNAISSLPRPPQSPPCGPACRPRRSAADTTASTHCPVATAPSTRPTPPAASADGDCRPC